VKRAIVLGVSHAQLDLIRYLKQAGWWVIGCSYRHEGRGIPLVDQFECIDIRDEAALLRLAEVVKPDLVYSVGSDFAMRSVAHVAARCGLPTFFPRETADLLAEKSEVRALLNSKNLSPVNYLAASHESETAQWNCYPAVVKPVDSQGQRGVSLVRSRGELIQAFHKAHGNSRQEKVIVEEFLPGPEVSVNCLVVDGQVVVVTVSDRLVANELGFGIPRGHVFPSVFCRDKTLVETKALAAHSIDALGVRNGPVYFQMKLTRQGPRVIEIAPRLDGCFLWKLIETTGSVDLLDATVRLLCGKKLPNLTLPLTMESQCLVFWLAQSGNVFRRQDYNAPDEAGAREFFYDDGEHVRSTNGISEKVGYCVCPAVAVEKWVRPAA